MGGALGIDVKIDPQLLYRMGGWKLEYDITRGRLENVNQLFDRQDKETI